MMAANRFAPIVARAGGTHNAGTPRRVAFRGVGLQETIWGK